MKILFLCTAHNSLSQRLYLELSRHHDVSIEYALSDRAMQDAVTLFRPDLIVCPFLTTRVPLDIYNRYLTLIIHPGPPGDAGPSALDWLLMGDDGFIEDSEQLLTGLNTNPLRPGRTHWGVTIIQAIEDFDTGPVWAFEQFAVDIDQPGLTKSELYRGPVTRAALTATRAAIARVEHAIRGRRMSVLVKQSIHYMPSLHADPDYARLSVASRLTFQGGRTCHRPLLKAAQREFDVTRHTAQQISRRIRSADSQPGALSYVFGVPLYVYGGTLEQNFEVHQQLVIPGTSTKIVGIRNDALCFEACDGKCIWISHVRRPKGADSALHPKVPALTCLLELGVLSTAQIESLQWPLTCGLLPAPSQTLQDIWVDIVIDENERRVAFLYWEIYNGAMGTDQCSRLIDAMDYILSRSTTYSPIHAVAIMGGSYFCNGIALNIAEAAIDPAQESWLNINRINDVVYYILHKFPSRGILTIAALRGNAAAGGVALAAACDLAMAGSEIVLNPAYRAIGLYGSEYHTLTYYARCGKNVAEKILKSMLPMSAIQAQRAGLLDYVFPGAGKELEEYMRTHIKLLLEPGCLWRGFWKARADLSRTSLARSRALELSEMSKDFWSARSARYHSRRFDFVRKVRPARTPLRFAKHRRTLENDRQDEEETDQFDDIGYFRKSAEEALLIKLHSKIHAEFNPSHGLSTAGVTPLETPGLTVFDNGNDKAETLFSCHYKPVEEPLTPPETPSDTHAEEEFFDGTENSEERLADGSR